MLLTLILSKIKGSGILLACQNNVNLCSWLQVSNQNKTLWESCFKHLLELYLPWLFLILFHGAPALYITCIFLKPSKSCFGRFAFQWPGYLIILPSSCKIRRRWRIPDGCTEPKERIFSGVEKWEPRGSLAVLDFSAKGSFWWGIWRLQSLCTLIVSILVLHLYLVVCFYLALEAPITAADHFGSQCISQNKTP